jgi:hypothetical protein
MSEDINKAEKLSKLYYANLLRKLNEGRSCKSILSNMRGINSKSI